MTSSDIEAKYNDIKANWNSRTDKEVAITELFALERQALALSQRDEVLITRIRSLRRRSN